MRAAVDREALTIAMAVVPGLCSRNKHFSLHDDPEVRRARARATTIRGVVRQLTGPHHEVTEVALVRGLPSPPHCELRFKISTMRYARRVLLSEAEAACVAWLASRAGFARLHPTHEDTLRVEDALRRLSAGLRIGEIDGLTAEE